MANRFLGLDSINVLKKYIDDQVALLANKSNLITLQAYKYVVNGTEVQAPMGGSYNPLGANIEYPDGWASLQDVLYSIGNTEALENALAVGSIWMSIGMAKGVNNFTDWSNPIKISGQNGVSVQFKYTYSDNSTFSEIKDEDLSNYPLELNGTNNKVYVWTRYAGEDWVGPRLWSNYAVDATRFYYRYKTTTTSDNPGTPTSYNDSDWMNSAAISLSNERPYMWMSIGQSSNDNTDNIVWSDPILFGHYAQNGKDGAPGKDGVKPDYSVTLYCTSKSVEVKPDFQTEIPGYEGKPNLDALKIANEDWTTTPDYTADDVCWCIVLNFNGVDDSLEEYSDVYRFSALDGECISCVRALYKFYWLSKDDILPEDKNSWSDVPYQKEGDNEGSLWMIMGTHQLDTVNNTLTLIGDWSDPVKLSGEQGPKGDTGEQGEPGKDGRKNVLSYTKDDINDVGFTIIDINDFDTNLYVSNSYGQVTYYINIRPDDGIIKDGDTIKIANIGNELIDITNFKNADELYDEDRYTFVGSHVEVDNFSLKPHESVELVCFEDKLLVIGKSLLEPTIDGGDSTSTSDSVEYNDDTTSTSWTLPNEIIFYKDIEDDVRMLYGDLNESNDYYGTYRLLELADDLNPKTFDGVDIETLCAEEGFESDVYVPIKKPQWETEYGELEEDCKAMTDHDTRCLYLSPNFTKENAIKILNLKDYSPYLVDPDGEW